MSNLAYDSDQHHEEHSESVDIDALSDMRPIPRISVQAFCESDGVAKPIERAGEDRRMTKAHLKVHMGGLDTAIEFYQSAPTPNLIILESRLEPKVLLSSLEQLAEVCDPNSKVVIIGHYNDVWLYRELIKAGISEYVVAPVSLADIVGMISTIFVNPEAEPLGKTFAFVGAKGGVGSSTIAHNLGWNISTLFNSEVVVADLDLPFGTANINFDQDPAQGIAEAVFSPERIDEVYLDRLLAQCAENLSMLAAPSTLDRVYDFEKDSFSQIIDTVQRSAPYVVLDIPHSWNAWTKSVLTLADEVIIVATPELANLRNAKNLVDTLTKARPNDTAPKLIINQIGIPKRPEISAAEFAEPLGLVPLAEIPFDPLLFGNASNNGRMLAETDAQHAVVAALNDISHMLTGRSELKAPKKRAIDGLLGRFKRKK
ncbi:MAG: CpaE family protein [Rhizobiaceae bacterium]